MNKQPAGKVTGQPVSFSHLCFAPALPHGRESFHFRERDFHRIDERLADPLISADHGQHTHIFGRGQLYIEEGYLSICIQ